MRFTGTADNQMSVFYGDENQANEFVGVHSNCLLKSVSNMEVQSYHYIYIVVTSDWSGFQGFIGQLENLNNSAKFVTGHSEWEVSATGRYQYAPLSGANYAMAELTQQIKLSNINGTVSKGWIKPQIGPQIGNGFIERHIGGYNYAGIDSTAKWIWYSSNGGYAFEPGANHQEYLIFRIRADAGLPKTCILCPIGTYCLGQNSNSVQCPADLYTTYTGSTSSQSCIAINRYLYQNLNSPTLFEKLNSNGIQTLFKIVNIPQLQNATLYYNMKCDSQYQQRMGYSCNSKEAFQFSSYLQSNTLLSSMNLTLLQLQQFNQFKNPFSFGDSGYFESELQFLGFYSSTMNNALTQSCVIATKFQEHHYRFLLYDGVTLAPDCLTFAINSSSSIELHYSNSTLSVSDNAQNDTFSETNPFTQIYTTPYSDLVIVHNSSNLSLPVPTFYLGSGNDEIQCNRDCIVYGQGGSNLFRVKNSYMKIQDFNLASDVIDLRQYQRNIRNSSMINVSYSSLSEFILILQFSNTSTIELNLPKKAIVNEVSILYDTVTCFDVCENCSQAQCPNCEGCLKCDTQKCTQCDQNKVLQEGKCIDYCTGIFKRHPTPNNNTCVPCNVSNCLNCAEIDKCYYCENDFIVSSSKCLACNLTYYSAKGDTSCKKCENGCDKCNSTHCFNCTQGHLMLPKLSQQLCYQDMSCDSEIKVVSNNPVLTTTSQKNIFNGIIFNIDGSISQPLNTLDIKNSLSLVDPSQFERLFQLDEEIVNSVNSQRSRLLFEEIQVPLSVKEQIYKHQNGRILQSKTLTLKNYKQNDQRWSNDVYGTKGNDKLNQYASQLTSLAMILATCGTTISGNLANPQNLNSWLKSNKGYSQSSTSINNINLETLGQFGLQVIKQKETKGNSLIRERRQQMTLLYKDELETKTS